MKGSSVINRFKSKLECGPMPNVMAAPPNICGALCEGSVIPFLVPPRRKVWLRSAAGVPCSNAANIRERKTWTQSEFCTCQNSVRGQKLPKCIYTVFRKKHPLLFSFITSSQIYQFAQKFQHL